jgi:TP901 family phage tail tape measure protein
MADSLGSIGKAFVDIVGDLSKLPASIAAGTPQIVNLAKGLGEAFTGAFSDAFKNVDLGKLGDELQKVGDAGKEVGKTLSEAISLPLAAGAAAAFASAIKIDEAMDTIRAGTGETGKALEDLGKDFEAVAVSVPNSFEAVAGAITTLHQRTGETGEALQAMATQLLNVSRLTGSDVNENVRESTRLFAAWKDQITNQGQALDFLFKVSQQTGASFGQLNQNLVQFAVPLHQLGLSFEQAAATIGIFEKEGINSEAALRSMQVTIAKLSDAGVKDLPAAFQYLISNIKNAGSAAEANQEALKIFGNRAGPQLVDAIRSGKLDVDDFVARINKSGETINKAADATLSFTDKMKEIGKQITVALAPIGDSLVKLATDALPTISLIIEGVGDLAKMFAALPEPVQASILALAGIAIAAGPVIIAAGVLVSNVGKLIEVYEAFQAATAVKTGTQLALNFTQMGTAAVTATEGISAIGIATTALAALPWVALAAAVGALAYAFYEYGVAAKGAHDAQNMLSDAQKKMADTLTAQGIAVDRSRLNDSAYLVQLRQQVQAHAELQPAIKGTTDATTKHGAAAKLSADDLDATRAAMAGTKSAAQQFKDQVEELTKKLTSGGNETRAMEVALQSMSKVPAAAVVKALGSDLIALGDASERSGTKLPPLVQKFVDLARADKEVADAQEELKNKLKAADGGWDTLESRLQTLVRIGKDPEDLLRAYGSEIVKLGQAHLDAGEPMDAFMRGLYDEAKAFTDSQAAAIEYNKTIREAGENLEKIERKPSEIIAAFQQMDFENKSAAEIYAVLGKSIKDVTEMVAELPIKLTDAERAELMEADAVRRQAEAHADLVKKVNDSSDALDKLRASPAGVVAAFEKLEARGASAAEISAILGSDIEKLNEDIRETPDKFDAATKSVAAEAEAVDKAAKIHAAFVKSVQDSKDSLDALRRSPEEVAQKFQLLHDAGYSDAEILDQMGGDIDKVVDAARRLGYPLDDATAAILRHAKAAEKDIEIAEAWHKAWVDAGEKFYKGTADALTKSLFEGQKFGDSMKSLFKGIAEDITSSFLEGGLKKIGAGLSDLVFGGGQQQGGGGSGFLGLGGLFGGGNKGGGGGGLLGLGGLFGGGGGGLNANNVLTGGETYGPANESGDFFGLGGLVGTGGGGGGGLGGLLGFGGGGGGGIPGLGSLGGLLGGGGGGGGALGGLLGMLGGLGGIGSLLSGGTQAITAIVGAVKSIGAGRKAADQLTNKDNGPEAKLGKALAALEDPLTAKKKAGTETADDVSSGLESLDALWSSYQQQMQLYTSQGGKSGLVAAQSLANLAPLVTKIKSDLTADLHRLGGTVGGSAGSAAAGAANFAPFNAGVDKFSTAVSMFADSVKAAGGGGPQTINISVDLSPSFKVEGGEITVADIRDKIVPGITDMLDTGVRGVLAKWVTLLKGAEAGVVSTTAPSTK